MTGSKIGLRDIRAGNVRRQAFERDMAFEHAVEAIGGALGQHHVLFHKHDRRAGGGDLRQHLVDLADDLRREPERYLVAKQKPRLGEKRPADGHHLLLAARQLLDLGPSPFLKDRKQPVDALERPRLFGRLSGMVDGDLQIVLDGHAGKQPPPFRHYGDAELHHAVRRAAADRAVFKEHHVATDGKKAHKGAQEGRFTRPVRADQGDDLSLGNAEIDGKKRLEVPVAGIETSGGEKIECRHHASIPMYTRWTSGLAITSLGGPSAIFSPKFNTRSRSATAMIALSTCSIQTIVMLRCLMRRTSATSWRASSSVRPPAISSSSSSFGSLASARASSSRFLSRSVSEPAARFAFAARPHSSRMAAQKALARRSLNAAPNMAATMRFSNVVMPA
ncbi:hypothetical protein AT6N2_C3020 [Agrobacterium tumefaciens]|nr:hypothetical protein AT6N2_C3020 [Agrobacterium tumefaciens]